MVVVLIKMLMLLNRILRNSNLFLPLKKTRYSKKIILQPLSMIIGIGEEKFLRKLRFINVVGRNRFCFGL